MNAPHPSASFRGENYVRSYPDPGPEGFWRAVLPYLMGIGFFLLMAFVIGGAK